MMRLRSRVRPERCGEAFRSLRRPVDNIVVSIQCSRYHRGLASSFLRGDWAVDQKSLKDRELFGRRMYLRLLSCSILRSVSSSRTLLCVVRPYSYEQAGRRSGFPTEQDPCHYELRASAPA